MRAVYDSPSATVVQGEAMTVLRDLPERYVDAIITDPPYSSGGMYRSDRANDPITKYMQSNYGGADLATFAGDNRDQRGYLAWCSLWMTEALRVAKPGAALVVFCDWRQLPVTTDAVQAGGWVWRGIIPWHKPLNRPQRGRFSAACEYMVWATAGHRPPDYPADTLQGHISVSAPQERSHPTEKPLAVLRHLVKIAPRDGLVLDPFAGSGTTAAAAIAERRRCLAVEVTEPYVNVIAERLRDIESGGSADQPTLFDEALPDIIEVTA